MNAQFHRNELYWGEGFQEKLAKTSVAIFGLGGVGGFALEALVRAGIGEFTLVDFDKISISNINRQIIATHSNVGISKVEAWKKRLVDINPNVKINAIEDFYSASLNEEIFAHSPNYVVDAIDTLRSKIELLEFCHTQKIKIITSLGAGNRMDCAQLKVCDLAEIKTNCQFAKNVIAKLKRVKIEANLPVVISDEPPKNLQKVENIEKITKKNGETIEFRKFTPASTSTVPAVCGYLMANWILGDMYNNFYDKII